MRQAKRPMHLLCQSARLKRGGTRSGSSSLLHSILGSIPLEYAASSRGDSSVALTDCFFKVLELTLVPFVGGC